MENARQKVAVLRGDGVGPEVVDATAEVVAAAAQACHLQLEFCPAKVGWTSYRQQGTTLPAETLAVLEECRAWIVGPTSAGDYPSDDPVRGHPSGYMRRHFELFANIRPVRAWPKLSALVPELATTIIRENTEGFYPDRNLHWGYGEFMPTRDVALSLRVITREACTRFARLSLAYAQAEGKEKVVVVHKRTALPRTDGVFLEAFEEAQQDFPGICVEPMRIDTFSSLLPQEPQRFGVVATTNLFGDIISDQASGLVGGVGLAPSLNAGTEHAMAQAVHGTAEDIAGKRVANPTALILSAAMLFEWLARSGAGSGWRDAGILIRDAIELVLYSGVRTPDLGGQASTSDITAAVVHSIEKRQ
jgi:3-isopropylmalate dehydrogenase